MIVTYTRSINGIIPLSCRYDPERQLLTFTGFDLPDGFEVDFSHEKQQDVATVIPGSNNAVHVPDEYIPGEKPVYGWIYLHPTENSGVTVYGFMFNQDGEQKDE